MQPVYPTPAHCAQRAAVQPPPLALVVEVADEVRVEDVVEDVVGGVVVLLVVVADEDEALEVADVLSVVDETEVDVLLVLVVLLTVLPPPTWKLPVNRISRELAPTLSPKVPAGTTHCCRVASQ